jgi:uncharacterized protein with PQ loop repeat
MVFNEDTIMSSVSIIFIIGMVAQIKKIILTKDTSAFSYTLIWGNTFSLSVICSCMFSLGLVFSGSVLILQCLSWASIGILKLICERKSDD